MQLKNYLFLFLILFSCKIIAQPKPYNNASFNDKIYERGLDSLYDVAKKTRLDAVHKLCLDFLKQHQLRYDEKAVFKLCSLFREKALADENVKLLRRIQIVLETQKLRFNSSSNVIAKQSLEKLFIDFKNEEDFSAALSCLSELGQYLGNSKNNLEVLQVLFYAEKFASKNELQNDLSMQRVLHTIGFVLWDLDKPVLSTKYLTKAIQTGNSSAMDSMISYNAIAINYQKLNHLKESNLYFERASDVALKHQNFIFNIVVKGNQAVTFYKLEQYDLAFKNANLDKNMCFQENLWGNAVGALNLLVKIELKRNNFGHAKTLLDSLNAIIVKIKPDDSFSLKRNEEANYLYYDSTKNFEKALTCYKNLVHLDSIYQMHANNNVISEMQINAAKKIYEEEMTKKENQKKLIKILTIILAVIILVLIFFLVSYLYKKVVSIEKEKTEINKIVESQAVEIDVLKIQLLNQLQLIKDENSHFRALQLSESQLHDDNDSKLEVASDSRENIEFLKNYNLSQKGNWEEFKIIFNSIYPNFQLNIASKINSISNAETRLLMLHKLGLSSKEIAEILFISAAAVKKAKYRLYKKIGISTVLELDDFIKSKLDVH
jgi:DNA-binding CsgD family transcriptional regulator